MPQSIDETLCYYDEPSRKIDGKLEIYFNGFEEEPLTVTRDDFLIDYEVLEEAGADDKNPLGAISANELTITLSNHEDMFSPAYKEGPYYGLIKVGVMIIPYIKPDEEGYEWKPLGKYFVSDWTSKLGSATASITCYDIVQELLLSVMPDIEVQLDTTYGKFIKYILTSCGFLTAEVDESLSRVLPYGFINTDKIKELIQNIVEASMSILNTNRSGGIVVSKLTRKDPAAIFTDDNQIITMDVPQSIIKTYNGVKLTYSLPQLSDYIEVLVVDKLPIPYGLTTHNLIKYSKPIFDISAAMLCGEKLCTIAQYSSTNFGINLTTDLDDKDGATCKLIVTGKVVDLVDQVIDDGLSNMLEIDNSYIQSTEYASTYKENLSRLVLSDIPEVDLNIRGNPDLIIGDTVEVHSVAYNMDFIGIIKRIKIKYAGYLESEMTLMNAEVLA